MRFVLLSSLAGLMLVAAPSWSQPERYPTEAELERLQTQLHEQADDLRQTSIYHDRRSSPEQQASQDFVAAWAEVAPAIAPFLGHWIAIEEDVLIVPTPDLSNEVCIVDTYLDGSEFYYGRVIDGRLYTDQNVVFFLESSFLGAASVYDDQAAVYPYANPLRPTDPASWGTFVAQHPEVVEQFQAAGCVVGEPNLLPDS